MNDCIFCKITNKEIPSYKIYEDEHAYAFLDIADDYVGHTLVVPKKHYETIMQCDADILHHLIDVVIKISNHYIDNCGFEGVNISTNNGAASGQAVKHLHFHVIPRKTGDNINVYTEVPKLNSDLNKTMNKFKIS